MKLGPSPRGMVNLDDGSDIKFSEPVVKAERVLPPFSGDTQCDKCGEFAMHEVRWIPPFGISLTGHQGECLERECRRCGYTWPEAVAS